MDISVEIAKHDKLHVTISISKKFSKMKNETKMSSVTGIDVTQLSSKRKLGEIRTQERMFQCFQAAQDNFQIRPTDWDEFSFSVF